MNNRKKSGFTLIEIIIVVAIIGLLAAALYVAIDPAKRIGDARDAKRYADVTAILNAILQYTVDTTTLPTAVSPGMTANIYYVVEDGSNGTGAVTDAIPCDEIGGSYSGVILGSSLVDKYLSTIPIDPRNTSATSSSQYYIKRSSNNRLTVGACEHYQSASLEVQR